MNVKGWTGETTSRATRWPLAGTTKACIVLIAFHPTSPFLTVMNADTPLKREWSLEERPGWLRLRGGPYDLTSLESPTMLLRKQTRSTGIWITELDFQPSKETYEAGSVLYWNLYTFASIGIRKSPSGNKTARELHITHPSSEEPGKFKVSILASIVDCSHKNSHELILAFYIQSA